MDSLDNFRGQAREARQFITGEKRIRLPSLGLQQSERKWLLFIVDLALLCLALIVTLKLRTELLVLPGAVTANWKWFVTLAAVWWGAATVFDCYSLARSASTTHGVTAAGRAALAATAVFQAIPWFAPTLVNRTQFFLFIALGTGAIMLWRYSYARLFVQPSFQRRALIVGAGSSGRALVQALKAATAQKDANPYLETGYVPVGFVDDKPEYAGTQVAGLPVLGNSLRLAGLARELTVDEIVVAITHKQTIRPALFEAILDCREMGLPVSAMTTVYERVTERVAVEHASLDIETATGKRVGSFERFGAGIKRLTDVVGSLVGLAFLGPMMILVWIGNLLSSPGPLFYRQERVGAGGQTFVLYKFRSMMPDAEKNGAVWAEKDDQRVTPVGRVLRRTHLDELPQALNVLKGQMSLVGPRPERPEFVQQLSQEIPLYRARHCVKPGITGWAQIHQDYGDSVERAREKLEYDLYYVKNAGTILDIMIILRTISKMAGLRGR